jgi:hypothetical protein
VGTQRDDASVIASHRGSKHGSVVVDIDGDTLQGRMLNNYR